MRRHLADSGAEREPGGWTPHVRARVLWLSGTRITPLDPKALFLGFLLYIAPLGQHLRGFWKSFSNLLRQGNFSTTLLHDLAS